MVRSTLDLSVVTRGGDFSSSSSTEYAYNYKPLSLAAYEITTVLVVLLMIK